MSFAGVGRREANAFIYRSMREETNQQQNDLPVSDERMFVTAVRDSVVSGTPALGDDPALLDRLVQAYDEARRMGLTDDELLAEFLFLEIEAPEFYRHPAILDWLSKPGASIDGRFRDLLDMLRKKIEQDSGHR